MSDTQEFTLRAMAENYSDGHQWDHLDSEACAKAADEIKQLRAAQSAPEKRKKASYVGVPAKWLSEKAGVPVDFKFQPRTFANERHNGPRNPIGRYINHRPPQEDE